MSLFDFLSPTIDIPKALTARLAGTTLELESAVVEFDPALVVTTEGHTLIFTPPAKVTAKAFKRLSRNVSAAAVSLDGITLVVDSFPDVTLKFKW